MATSLSRAWNALQKGDYGNAQRSFQSALEGESNQAYAFMGLAGASLAMGNLRDALSYGERALETSDNPEADLLLAEIQSRLGNRDEAKRHLSSYLRAVGESPYARALLGEQQIRTAHWDEGADSYIEALRRDREGRAERQFKQVVADLTEVVASGRMPVDYAEQFLNRVDYNLGDKSESLTGFIAKARRALGSNERIHVDESESPIFEILESIEPAPASGGSTSPSSSSAGGHRSNQLGPPPSDGPPEVPGEEPTGPPPAEETSSKDERESGIDAKQKNLADVIQKDRAQNESLQEVLGSMFPPEWPSDPDSGELDPLASMAWEEQSIFSDAPKIDSTDFRITSGSVRAEIFLERCLQNLLVAAKRERAVSIRYQPETIMQLEVNCEDGLLERLPSISSIYDEFHDPARYAELALGRVLGECIAQPYDGTWEFEEPPRRSRLLIGNEQLDPIGIAADWVRADDRDEIDLEQLKYQAERAAEASTSLTSRQGYIDPTRELEGTSLAVKLAELWTNYLFRLAEGSFSDVAETLELELVEETVILAGIHRRYCPDAAAGPDDASVLEGNRVPIVYQRETGEFLMPASRKHAARCAGCLYGPPTADNASDVITFFDQYHRRDWVVATNSQTADWIRQRSGHESVDTPALTHRGGNVALQFWMLTSTGAMQFSFMHAPDRDPPWRLAVV